ISKLINFTYSDELGGSIPVQEVNGENKGINHSFRVIYDQFAKSDKRLVNHKQYYFLAIAYAFNEYKKYSQDLLAQIPGVSGLDGQKKPYLAGRKSAGGQPISYVVGIPHISNPEFGGNIMTGSYGEGVKIQRIEGQGNGGNVIAFSKSSIEEALLAPAYKCINPIYLNGKGPVDIKVINPLRVVKGNFILKFDVKNDKIDTARWIIINKDNGNIYNSDKNIGSPNEQLFLDLGLSVTIKQVKVPGDKNAIKNGYLNPSELDKNFKEMLFADSSKVWLWGIPDVDGSSSWNWIRSGTLADKDVPDNNDYNYTHDQNGTIAGTGLDDDEYYEKVVGRKWAPYRLCSKFTYGPAWNNGAVMDANKLENIASVDVVLTPDKSKWTRCPVIETCEDKLLAEKQVEKFSLRSGYSIDKDGNPDKNNTGMGWFPGYAVNLETGERLNMMYGENSWLVGENGNDMKFNPTYNYYTSLGELLWGGMHFIYIMGHNGDGANDCPAYDEGKWLYDKLNSGTMANKVHAYKSAMWVNIPVAVESEDWLACDVTIRLRVAKPYKRFYSTTANTAPAPLNNNYPMYSFNTNDIYTEINHKTTAKNALDLINIVPNPYYAYSKYEASQLDNIVKITNLPQKSTISIYSVNGVLIRQFKVDKSLTTSLKETGVLEPVTSIEWDLKNFAGIPISGGLYLIHINAPGLGEKVIKWFGVLRPTDTSSF
ncbi:MAG: hypothetical protein KA792_11150, partial [Bacteroidales bacterium]|nr:hypothetical protein [Bacteroidales bacterium]